MSIAESNGGPSAWTTAGSNTSPKRTAPGPLSWRIRENCKLLRQRHVEGPHDDAGHGVIFGIARRLELDVLRLAQRQLVETVSQAGRQQGRAGDLAAGGDDEPHADRALDAELLGLGWVVVAGVDVAVIALGQCARLDRRDAHRRRRIACA